MNYIYKNVNLFNAIGWIGVMFPSLSFCGSLNYIYDSENRLISVKYGNGSEIKYAYDATGNRVSYLATAPRSTTAETLVLTGGLNRQISISKEVAAGTVFEWYRNGVKFANTTEPRLPVAAFSIQDAGGYRVIIREASGMISIVELIVKIKGLTYQSWLRHKEGSNASPADPGLGKMSSPRNDGIMNILKYAFGKGPNESMATAQPESVILGEGAAKRSGIRFHRLIEPLDITIKVEASADMSSWRDVTNEMSAAGNPVPSPDGITEQITLQCPVALDQAGAKAWKFMRVAVQDLQQPSLVFTDEFNGGPLLDPLKWTVESGGDVVVADGMAALTSGSAWTKSFDTAEKFSRRSDHWIIECRMKRDSEYDVIFSLTDGVNTIGFLDSTWNTVNGYRFFSGGGFGSEQIGVGSPTTDWMEYRMTIDGTSVLCERGPTLSNITQTIPSSLAVPASQYDLFLSLSNGGHSTARFDWIRIK